MSENAERLAVRKAALEEWVQSATAEGRLAEGDVTPAKIALIAKSQLNAPADVGRRAPSLKDHAEEIIALLRRADPADSAEPAGSIGDPGAGPAEPVAAPGPAGSTEAALDTDTPPDLATGYAEATDAVPTPVRRVLAHEPTASGIRYRWPQPGVAPVEIFRLVASDDERPVVPDDARLVRATTELSALDPVPTSSALRYVQVWVNSGPDLASAKAAQPELWAERVEVGAIRDPFLQEDHGQITASWRAPGGTVAVRVYRAREDEPGSEGVRVGPGESNISGFVDTWFLENPSERGIPHVYLAVVEVLDGQGNTALSEPVALRVVPSAVLTGVDDLDCQVIKAPSETSPGQVDLWWTPLTTGEVRIYRIPRRPESGVVGARVDEGSLEGMGLTAASWLRNPIDPPDASGRVRMRSVPWPPGWTKPYFVPVTVINGQATVGREVSVVTVAAPGTPTLVDRVTEQLITFAWPDGAHQVRAYLAPAGADPDLASQGHALVELSREEYIRRGGLRMDLSSSPDLQAGKAIDIVLRSVVSGSTVGPAVAVRYEARLVVRYSAEVTRRLRFAGAPNAVKVTAWTGMSATGSPPFVVTFNPDRLPMHPTDGDILEGVDDDLPDGPTSRVYKPATLMGGPESPQWRAMLPGKQSRGYVRMFLSPSVAPEIRDRVVVIDPPIDSLRWS